MPKKHQKNHKNVNQSPITTNLLIQNQSNLNPSMNLSHTSQKQSYTQYIQNFQKQHHPIDYQRSTNSAIQKSLSQMRILLKQFNKMINKMMDKNYQLLAEHTTSLTQPQPTVQKSIQVLQAQIQNSRKLISRQQSQIQNLTAIGQTIKDKQQYEQKLIDEIANVKDKMPSISLESKHNMSDINKNGYTLMYQQQDTTLYDKVNHLRNDYERAYERYRKIQNKQKQLDQKLMQFEEKDYQITQKLDQNIQKAKKMGLEITATGHIISFKQQYEQLQKKREHTSKKIALFQHVTKANQQNIQKDIQDMKRLMVQYQSKTQLIELKIRKVQQSNDDILNKSNIVGELTKKSLPYKFAQTLLKSQQSLLGNTKNGQNIGNSRIKNNRSKIDNDLDLDNYNPINNKSRVKNNKPYLPLRKSNKNEIDKARSYDFDDGNEKNRRNQSKPQINIRKSQIYDKQENEEINKNGKNMSQIFNIRKRNNSRTKIQQQSPKTKHWRQDSVIDNSKDKNQYKVSKPTFSLRKKGNSMKNQQNNILNDKTKSNQEQTTPQIAAPRFSRLANNKRRMNKDDDDEYMRYLQDKGRKILGIQDKQ